VVRWLIPFALALAGCNPRHFIRDVALEGVLVVQPPERQPLRLDPATGEPTIHDRSIDLPRAQEDVRQGVVALDSTPLPPGWRPLHAPEGGLLISAVDAASPLGLAGLRPYDLVLAVDGSAPPTLDGLREALGRPSVALRVRHLDGREERLEAQAAPRVRGQNRVACFVADVAWNHTGLGWDLAGAYLVWCDSLVRHAPRKGYADAFGWGALLDLVVYRRWTDRATGEEAWCLDLLWWVHLGDTPWDEEEGA
jgi:hypothetical protein